MLKNVLELMCLAVLAWVLVSLFFSVREARKIERLISGR